MKRSLSSADRTNIISGAYLLLALLIVPVFPHFLSPNEVSRWATATAIVESGTLEISGPLAAIGGNVEDVSRTDRGVFSNKAPGATLVGLPGFLLAHLAGDSSLRSGITSMRILASTLPLLLLAGGLWSFARREGESDRAPLIVFVLLFGTPLFAYGLLLFSHALTAAAIFGAWLFLYSTSAAPSRARDALLAGALIGLSVLSEYTTAIPCAVLVAGLVVSRRWKDLAFVTAGGIPFALILAIHNKIAFGGPLELSSAHESNAAFRELASQGLFGIGWPDPLTFLRLLFDPARGLFIFTPVLMLSLAGLSAMKARIPPAAFWTAVLTPLSVVVLISGYPNWHGGWSVGPRYLLAAVPFLLLPLLYMRRSGLATFLSGWSVLAVVLTTIVFPFVPNAFPLPWGTFALPLLTRGLVAPSALHFLARAAAIALPLVVVAASCVLAVGRRRLPLFLAGAALALGISVAAGAMRSSPSLDLQRAYVEEVYFEQKGVLIRHAPVPPRLLMRREREMRLPPSSWPF